MRTWVAWEGAARAVTGACVCGTEVIRVANERSEQALQSARPPTS